MDKYQHSINCILSLQKYLDCDILTQDTKREYPIFTIRYIDLIIHLLNNFGINDYDTHLQHQKNILKIVKGCEMNIFNDPKVKYPNRKHFNGMYGTMSNILTSYYFYLYWHLLEKGVKVNIEEDCKTMFFILQNINYQSIPKTELEYINNIIQYFKDNSEDCPFFTRQWWEWFRNELIHNIQEIKKHKFYQNQQNPYTKRINYLNTRIAKAIEKLTNIRSHLYQPYEYSPSYTGLSIDTSIIEQCKHVKKLFLQIDKK